ncbi:MAG: eukaryotic-like serine/threonine-protein kinase [Myxococcales bacterium]|nr:eukaryotic-like serine/threonine-protein kinase [Myxococcales bacterium]
MGRVWVAEHLTLETNVVVKFMASDIAATADGAARFGREAAVAAAVKSPHVVQVFDHGVTPEGDAYIVMEMLEGRDLAAHLAASGPMDPRDVAALVAQVAKALGKAHQVGVVHRDIKPDNIFLCDAEGGELFVKLLDFGIAKRDQHKVTSAATTTGAVVGTPYYMSPEQIVGDKDTDARTDIWSLGVVAYEAMTGRRPFEGTTVGAITLAIHTATRRITDHLPSAPRALDDWFAKACARNVKERYQTPREAAQALLQATGDLAALAASSPMIRPPMPSIVGDGSDPSVANQAHAMPGGPPADGRAATHLSSVFPTPSARPSRARPALVIGGIAVALVVVAGMFVVPAILKPRVEQAVNGVGHPPFGGAAPSASASSDENAAAIWPATGVGTGAGTAGAGAGTATATVTAATPSSTGATTLASASVVPSRAPAGVSGRPGTRPTTTTTKPTKPGRTRDDDDIK